jgi:16S rRNA processing protein RimM
MSSENRDLVTVGSIVGAHGIRGEIKVKSYTDHLQRFDAGSRLLLSEAGEVREVEIVSSRPHRNLYLLTLEGVADRTAAESLRGSTLHVAAEDLIPLPAGEYYDFQLLDLAVVTDEGEDLGRVAEVMATGSNLVLIVRDGAREVLLPFIDDVVREVDLAGGRMKVHLMEGLLPDD